MQMRFAIIWIAIAIPRAAFLAIASMGQALVRMSRGIDLSVPAIMALSRTLLLGVSGGSNDARFGAFVLALVMLKTMGVATAVQMIIQGVAIALGMGLSQFRLPFSSIFPGKTRGP